MLITNRRLRLLFTCLAGMDSAALLPWLAILMSLWAEGSAPVAQGGLDLLRGRPLVAFIAIWTTLLIYMFAADWLNRQAVQSPQREVIIFSLLILTSLFAIRMLLYGGDAFTDLTWLQGTLTAVFQFTEGLRGELLILGTNFFLWWRVADYTDRSLSFFMVGRSFRLGMLLALIGSGTANAWTAVPAPTVIVYFLLFMSFGLATVALARIDHKAVGATHSTGALMPWSRFAQLLLAVGVVIGAALAAAQVYTPATLRIVLGWFGPVGALLRWIFVQFVILFFMIFGPALEALAAYIQRIMAEAPQQELPEAMPTQTPVTPAELVRDMAMLRYCLVIGAILLACLLLWIFFARTRLFVRSSDSEETSSEEIDHHPGRLRLGLDRLRNWAALLRRYGPGPRLLNALSVENIYINLVRVARRRGHPRRPAQAPENFLPTLQEIFPGHDAALENITTAYLRVRYGDRTITAAELEELREDYARIMEPPDIPDIKEDDSPDNMDGRDGNGPRYEDRDEDRAGSDD